MDGWMDELDLPGDDESVAGRFAYFVGEGEIGVVGPSDGNINHVHPSVDGVIERVHEPRRIRHLIIRKNFVAVQLHVGGLRNMYVTVVRMLLCM